jgi:lycopene cyclase CruA
VVAVLEEKQTGSFDLGEFRRRFPLTVANLGAVPNREMWLRRIWELDERWQKSQADGAFTEQIEVLTGGKPPANLAVEEEFDIIYAGGGLGLLHAAVMSKSYGRKTLVFDAHTVGRTHRDWNISDEELQEFVRAKLFTMEEIERAVVNRYRTGFVKFHDANSRLKTPPLYMEGVLDVAIEADILLELAAQKLKNSATDSLSLNSCKFVRAYIQPDKVFVETANATTGERKLFAARLFVDATGTNSPVSRQINAGRSITHVCPTVGTVARGFVRGEETDAVDFSVGEILVSTEDCSADRQLIWEGFAGSPVHDDYTTYLFFYDSVNSPADKSLLNLFEEYFEKLPTYKRPGSQWRVVKPVFGYIPSYHHHGWNNQKKTAQNRVLLIGDAAGLSSPLTFCGFGSHVRNLRRLTHLTELALKGDLLDETALGEINAYEPRVSQMASLAEFMRPTAKSRPQVVNETMNAVMQALTDLSENVRRDLFKDRISFAAFKSLLKRTATIHPAVFKRMFEHLGTKGAFWWIANIAEAALHERKARKNDNKIDFTAPATEQEFAHFLEFYKTESGR